MRSYTIKITMLEEELELLKNALKSYTKGDKDTISDLLGMIECQESKQSDLASDTQKAFKEGYIKATLDRSNEIAELNAENAILKTKHEAFIYDIKREAVKEFAEKLYEICMSRIKNEGFTCFFEGHIGVKDIATLLKEYEVEEWENK